MVFFATCKHAFQSVIRILAVQDHQHESLTHMATVIIFLYAHLGIRYAEAPVGDLRFSKPVSAAGWTGVREATEVNQSCPQINYLNPTGAVNSISIDYSFTLVRNRKWQQCCSVTCYLVVMACVLLQAIPSDESKILLSSHM